VAMLFCQLGRAHSLREIEGGGIEKLRGQTQSPRDRGPATCLARLRQRPPPLAALREALWPALCPAERERGTRAQVPLQEQAREPRCEHHRPVPFGLRLGEVSAHQGGGEAALDSRPRRPPPQWALQELQIPE
jgi:hypothetical protein